MKYSKLEDKFESDPLDSFGMDSAGDKIVLIISAVSSLQGTRDEMTAIPIFLFMRATAWPSLELGCVMYYVRLVMLPVHKPYISSCVMQLSCRVRSRYASPVCVHLLKRQVAPSLPNMHSNFPCVLRMQASFQVIHIELICIA